MQKEELKEWECYFGGEVVYVWVEYRRCHVNHQQTI